MLAVWLSGGDNANATSPLPSLTLLGLSKCGRRPSQCGQPFGARPNAAKKRGLETGRLEESPGSDASAAPCFCFCCWRLSSRAGDERQVQILRSFTDNWVSPFRLKAALPLS